MSPSFTEHTFREYLDLFGPVQFAPAIYSATIFKKAIFVFTLGLISAYIYKRHTSHFWEFFFEYRVGLKSVAINLISFTVLLGMLILVNDPVPLIANPYSLLSLAYACSPALWAIYFGSIMGCLVPRRILKKWVGSNIVLTGLILIAFILFAIPEEGIVNFLSTLLLQPALDIALALTREIGLDAHILPNPGHGPLFGTNRFMVEILPACSGYEGIVLMIALLATYCYLQRDRLHVYRALLIIPLASLAMFFLNSVRIALLIAIGHFYSPQLALDGFHVVGGWLNLLLVLILSMLVLSLVFFQKEAKSKALIGLGETTLLTPLVSLIIVSLLTKAINPDFAWLYPAHIVVTTWILYFFHKSFLLFLTRPSTISIGIGVVVFILWITLIPEDPVQSAHFIEELNSVPLWFSFSWLLFRVLGASIIVPIAEEFTFRGYIQPKLEYWFYRKGFKSASVIASLGITALFFGYVHSNILAGSVAGLFFGLAYLQRKRLMDAVMAHAVTNTLLAVYVISFGYWSYW